MADTPRTPPPRLTLEDESPRRVPVREFIVDILGSLVPGLLFSAAIAPALLIPCFSLVKVVEGEGVGEPLLGETVSSFASTYRFELVTIFVGVAYVVGHVFFRQDPKRPDRRSFALLNRTGDYDGPACEGCEFPYLGLREYLNRRGFHHLETMVPWRDSGETSLLRSKHHINLYKSRLEFVFPERYGRIARNEAHIRLNSSVWYVARALVWLSLVGLALGISAMGLSLLDGRSSISPLSLNIRPAVFPALVLGGSAWLRGRIERAFHYQRVREVIFILETAYFANLIKPGMFEPLSREWGETATTAPPTRSRNSKTVG